jgi:hypothetical protein
MRLSEYKGMSIGEIESRLENDVTMLALGGERAEEMVVQLTKQHGNRAGAILAGAALYAEQVKENNPALAIREAVIAWYQAAEQANEGYQDRAEFLRNEANNLAGWLAYGSVHVPRKYNSSALSYGSLFDKEWPVKLKDMKADEYLSLGNFLIYLVFKLLDAEVEGMNMSQRLGYDMALRALHDVNKWFEKQECRKKKKKFPVERYM